MLLFQLTHVESSLKFKGVCQIEKRTASRFETLLLFSSNPFETTLVFGLIDFPQSFSPKHDVSLKFFGAHTTKQSLLFHKTVLLASTLGYPATLKTAANR
jgi:hypothetical protein